MPPKKKRLGYKQERNRRERNQKSRADIADDSKFISHSESDNRRLSGIRAAADKRSEDAEQSWKVKAQNLEKQLAALKREKKNLAIQVGMLKKNRLKDLVSARVFAAPRRRGNRDKKEDEREADIILLVKFQQLLSWRTMRKIRQAAAKVYYRTHSTGLGLSSELDVGHAIQRACKEVLARGVMMVPLFFSFCLVNCARIFLNCYFYII